MLLIELNEFSVEFLREASASQATPTIDKILGWPCCRTNAEEKTERHGLDPWVQWVSIHTGVAAREHGIAHLAEADKLQHDQIWDHLNKQGFSTTVWGAMNSKNHRHRLMKAFLPDPWSYSEVAAPDELNGLLALPRLYARNYVRPNLWHLAGGTLKTGRYLLTRQFGVALKNLAIWTGSVVRGGLNNVVLFALFDNVSAKVFQESCTRSKSNFKLVFFNSIAHLQHHDWRPESTKVQAAIRLLENTLTTVITVAAEGEPVLIANGLSQVCTTSNNDFLYRPVDPQGLITAFQIQYSHVEQMMTNDGHIFFNDVESCDEAFTVLSAATVDGQKAFDVDRRGDTQLFYQFSIWDELPQSATINVNRLSLNFFEHFEKLVQRTGSHIPCGEIFHTNIELPDKIWNHELFNIIKEHYV